MDQLKRDEGELLHVYKDSLGIKTAGVGHNLESHGIDLEVGTIISQKQCDQWLAEDIADAETKLAEALPWTNDLDEVRQGALINMCFNMGIGKPGGTHGLLSFPHTLAMIQAGNYEGAASAMLESKWSKQVGIRATRLAAQIETGEWQ